MRRDEFPIVDKVIELEINSILEDIKAEIKNLVTKGENDYQLGMNGALFRVFQIINNSHKQKGTE